VKENQTVATVPTFRMRVRHARVERPPTALRSKRLDAEVSLLSLSNVTGLSMTRLSLVERGFKQATPTELRAVNSALKQIVARNRQPVTTTDVKTSALRRIASRGRS
jgi:hypothetical protein